MCSENTDPAMFESNLMQLVQHVTGRVELLDMDRIVQERDTKLL